MADDRTALADSLGVAPAQIAFLDGVDDEVVAALRDALDQAQRQQEAALGRAFDGAIRIVPRPVRARLRRLLTGGRA